MEVKIAKMRLIIIAIFVGLLILMILLAICMPGVQAQSPTIVYYPIVSAPDSQYAEQANFTDIQQAIDSLNGKPGTVLLLSGNYQITKSLVMDSNAQSLICEGTARINTPNDIVGITISQPVTLSNLVFNNTGVSTKSAVKMVNGAKLCQLNNIKTDNFKYGLFMYSTVEGGVGYNTINGGYFDGLYRAIYINSSTPGWCNENTFIGCKVACQNGSFIEADGNDNKFYGLCLEGNGGVGNFSVIENGVNMWDGIRFETDCYGIKVNNTITLPNRITRISDSYWDCRYPQVAVVGGRAYIDRMNPSAFNGIIVANDNATTQVNKSSVLGQKTLYVTSTTGFFVDSTIVIESGTTKEEWASVASVTSTSLKLYNVLLKNHVSGSVISKGKKFGTNLMATGVN